LEGGSKRRLARGFFWAYLPIVEVYVPPVEVLHGLDLIVDEVGVLPRVRFIPISDEVVEERAAWECCLLLLSAALAIQQHFLKQQVSNGES